MAERENAVPTVRERRGAPAVRTDGLARGTTVDRYIILDLLGEGGMGVVYTAFDPELDRKVAIKLLQARDDHGACGAEPRATEPLPDAGPDREQQWLVREAQALARLAHPNVVTVHDVGTLPGRRVFIAMELVEGETLRAWLATSRPWREVVRVLRAVGAGLAAVHAAGLVHRDIKPENVIVGVDGRVRVMDFGLARHAGAADGSDRIAGTPAYIAPELYAGGDADARSDQFAFGLVLYEALFGVRAYTPEGLANPAVCRSAKPPEDPRVPAALTRIAMRAIALDPEARYPSMEALLAELDVDPHAARRRIARASGAVLVAGGAVVAALALRPAAPEPANELCTGADRRLAGVWDRAVAGEGRAAFAATHKPFAAQSFAAVEHALDDYAASWSAAVTDSCRATRVTGEQTEEVMMLRADCFDRRLDELRALARLVATASGSLVDKGDKAVFELEPVAKCANLVALREPGLPPESSRTRLAAIEHDVAGAKAQLIAGAYLPAIDSAATAADAANALAWPPLAGEAMFVRASALLAVGNFAVAAQVFADTCWTAMRARRDDLAAASALAAALATSDGLGDPDKARLWLGVGIASAARAGIDHVVELRRYEVEGLVLAEAGDLEAAIAAHEHALAIAERAHGVDSPALWADEEILATTYTKAGAFPKAIPHYERALRMREASVGSEQPEISILLSNLGHSYRRVRDFPRARAALERALALREQLYGPTSTLLVAPLDNLADLTAMEGDLAGAIAIFDRGIALASVIPGPTHPIYHQIVTDRAEVLGRAGRFADARAAYTEVLALEEANHSPALPATQSSRAEVALLEHAWAEAATWAERAIAGTEAKGGSSSPLLWLPLTRLGEAKLGLGKPDDARRLFDRALAIGERAAITPADLARTRADRAKLGDLR